nr:GDSL esterase/lipase 1-like [Tanacetum cinerariifolium]
FKVGDSACCGTGPFRGIDSCGGKREVKEFELCDNISDYLFFDSNHCTEVANRQYAELFWDGDSSVATPYNLKAFFHASYRNMISKHVALFVFGDSLYDPGNNNYINTTADFRANFWPYGVSYFSPPGGRFSDGRLIPDFIAEFAGLPLIPTYLDPRNTEFTYGANFASGGAGALVESHDGFVIDLKTQLQYFKDLEKQFRQNLGDAETNRLLSDAVYLFSCGGNDYLSPEGNNDSVLYPYTYTHEEYVGLVIGNLTNVFKGIYAKGGRKFGIITVPPLACWPSIRAERPGNTCSEELGVIVSLHNQKLSEKLQELENQLEGFIYAKFDQSTEINKRMTNPSKYGFKVGDTACCGSGP